MGVQGKKESIDLKKLVFPYRCMKAAVDMLLSMGRFHKSQPSCGDTAF